jgi:hypothetical protein
MYFVLYVYGFNEWFCLFGLGLNNLDEVCIWRKAVLGFKLRATCLLGSHSTTYTKPPAFLL